MRLRSHATSLLLCAVSTAALGLVTTATATAAPEDAGSRVVLSQGHVDIVGVAFEDGEFNVHVHDETTEPGQERDPSEVLFHVKPEARIAVPADPAYQFLGSPGAPVWVLPQEPDEDLLFAGLGTEELEPGVFRGDQVRVHLLGVRGPGQFSLFTVDAQGAPNVLWDSGNGLPDTLVLPVGSHQHANWAFEAEGDYTLYVLVSGRLTSGEHVWSDVVAYRFRVGPLS